MFSELTKTPFSGIVRAAEPNATLHDQALKECLLVGKQSSASGGSAEPFVAHLGDRI